METSELTLRPYQTEALESLRANMRRGVRRQVLCLPTGAGKTIVAVALAKAAQAKGSRVAFVCDRQVLVRQTAAVFGDHGVDHGILMGDATFGVGEKVRVCSAQTLESRGFHETDLLIVDECHSQRKALAKHVAAHDVPVVGLSATPLAKGMGETYEAVVNAATTQGLISEGFLAPLRIVAPVAEVDVDGLKVSAAGEWSKADVGERVLRITGDVVPEWKRQCDAHFGGEAVPTIVFAPSVADSEALASEFRAAGHDFAVVSYRQTSEQKDEIVKRFRAGEHTGLVNCAVLERGFDAPETRILVDCYPMRKSLMTVLQRYGRVMRTADGKDCGLVIDHASNYLAFGGDVMDFYERGVDALDDGRFDDAKRPKDMDERRKELVCPNCRAVMEPAWDVCRVCGSPKPKRRGSRRYDRVSGRLELVDEATGHVRRIDRRALWINLCRNATARHPLDPGRARKMALASYRAITGVWPRAGFAPDPAPCDPEIARIAREGYDKWLNKQRRKGYARRNGR